MYSMILPAGNAKVFVDQIFRIFDKALVELCQECIVVLLFHDELLLKDLEERLLCFAFQQIDAALVV